MKKKNPARKGFRVPADLENPTLEEFASMVEAHDPTFVWSEDEAAVERGLAEREVIDLVRNALEERSAVGVWNRAMHRKVVPSMLSEFLWSVRGGVRPQGD